MERTGYPKSGGTVKASQFRTWLIALVFFGDTVVFAERPYEAPVDQAKESQDLAGGTDAEGNPLMENKPTILQNSPTVVTPTPTPTPDPNKPNALQAIQSMLGAMGGGGGGAGTAKPGTQPTGTQPGGTQPGGTGQPTGTTGTTPTGGTATAPNHRQEREWAPSDDSDQDLDPADADEKGDWISPLDNKTYRVSSCVGDSRAYRGGTHAGVDLAAPSGTKIKAPAAGKITFTGNIGGHCGWGIKMVSGDYAILMCHMERGTPRGREGMSIPKGFNLGRVGNTGTSSGPHLHMEIKKLTGKKATRANPLHMIPDIAEKSTNGNGPCSPSPGGGRGGGGGPTSRGKIKGRSR